LAVAVAAANAQTSLNIKRAALRLPVQWSASKYATCYGAEEFRAVLGFVVNRQSPHYAGRLALEAAADILATAAGHWGSGAEHLRETVVRLEKLNIHDRNLWRLQALVAERIGVEDECLSGTRHQQDIEVLVGN
jgi:glutathione-specific gamma-glutamylcyclotransferase